MPVIFSPGRYGRSPAYHLTCDIPFPPRSGGIQWKGIISACLSCQGVERSVWDPETFAHGRRHVPRGAPSLRSGYVIGTDSWMSAPPCPPRPARWPNLEWGYSSRCHMLGRECPEAVSLDRPLYLPTFSHVFIVNKPLSLARALSRSLSPPPGRAQRSPFPPPPLPSPPLSLSSLPSAFPGLEAGEESHAVEPRPPAFSVDACRR